MNLSRRNFLGGLAAGAALAAVPGCMTNTCKTKCAGNAMRPGKVALQLYSIRHYIKQVGLEKALAEVAAIGYEGVEFAGYYDFTAPQLKKMLDDNGLVACGTHVNHRSDFSPAKIQKTIDFNLGYGNKFICCPGGGNMPPGFKWSGEGTCTKKTMDWMKALIEHYNKAAETAAKSGALIGLHNHHWEFMVKLENGQTYFDYFFSNTNKAVQMELDVGWATFAGADPCALYKKYPGRSYTLHARENGKGAPGVKIIVGQPQPGVKGVEWDRLFPVTDADNVQWYVVECAGLTKDLTEIKPSFDFLKSKGRI